MNKFNVQKGDTAIVINPNSNVQTPVYAKVFYVHPTNRFLVVDFPKGYRQGYSFVSSTYIGFVRDETAYLKEDEMPLKELELKKYAQG